MSPSSWQYIVTPDVTNLERISLGIVADIWSAVRDLQSLRNVGKALGEMESLKQRIANLESKLDPDIWPPDVCKACGRRELRMDEPAIDGHGNTEQHWRCNSCNKQEFRTFKPR